MINSRSTNDLDPEARTVALNHLAACHAKGIELIITSTWRDFESQEALYAIGRTTELSRRPVTNARGGQSWHNYKCAWDVVPVVSGKPVWDDRDPLWKEVILCGKDVGAEAGADWVSFPDLPHFQKRPSDMTLDLARVTFQKNGTIFTA